MKKISVEITGSATNVVRALERARSRRGKWRFLDWTARHAHVAAQFQFEPRTLWVGATWNWHRSRGEHTGWDRVHGEIVAMPWSLHVYVTVIPMLPLHVFIQRTVRP